MKKHKFLHRILGECTYKPAMAKVIVYYYRNVKNNGYVIIMSNSCKKLSNKTKFIGKKVKIRSQLFLHRGHKFAKEKTEFKNQKVFLYNLVCYM